ncbi:TIGR00730 family Rossman fold protein [Mucilaginibacter sp. CAU 1740]|uniref:LOG family protein n=1 Tax=Mucilaginibacter sp. CAU 1740 TaxID=3140365 RepID=UPI00325BD637
MKAICIFCGANYNGDPVLKQTIDQLAEVMVSRNISLVYGGGKVGVMGLIADAVLSRGGKAIGVIPQFLMDKEVGHTGLTELHIVENMHQRKQMMNDLSDGVITLPGGLGTLEEFFEVLTWLQLGLHNHPVGLLNVNGFYDLLLQQLDVMVEQRFMKKVNRDLIITSADAIELVNLMDSFKPVREEVWFKDKNLI